jgi:CRISPR-associated protein Cas2
MLIVSYDFRDDKRRTKFSNFLKKYGRRLQYSVFEIKNSSRVLQNILKEIECKHKPFFGSTDSILIYQTCKTCDKKILRYGYAVHEEKELVFFG